MCGILVRWTLTSLCLTIFFLFIEARSAIAQDKKPAVEIALGMADTFYNIKSVAISPDGKLALSANDSSLMLWELKSGKLIRVMPGHSGQISSVVFLPNGTRALSGGDDRSVRLWDLESGETIQIYKEMDGPIAAISLVDNDKRFIAGTSFGSAYLIELENFRLLRILKSEEFLKSITAARSSGDLAVISGFLGAGIWNLSSGEKVRMLPKQTGLLALSEQGELFSTDGIQIRVFNVSTGSELKTLAGHTDRISAISISPDGSILMTGDVGGHIILWSTGTKTNLGSIKIPKAQINSIAISPDGKNALLGSLGGDAAVQLLDVPSLNPARVFRSTGQRAQKVASTWNNNAVVAVSRGRAHILDRSTGVVGRSFGQNITAVSLSLDGKVLWAGKADGEITVVDLPSGLERRSLKRHSAQVMAVEFSPDGKKVISGGMDGAVTIWDAASGEPIRSLTAPKTSPSSQQKKAGFDPNAIYFAQFSPDGLKAIAGGQSGSIRVWEVETGKLLKILKEADEWALVFSAKMLSNGKTIISANASGTKQWEWPSGQLVRTLPQRSRAISASNNAFSFLSGDEDAKIREWSVETGQATKILHGHLGSVRGISISPDGLRAVSVSPRDGIFALWDVSNASLQIRALIYGEEWLTITPEGFFDISSAAAAQNINVVRGFEVYSIDQVYQALYRPDLVREKLAGDPKGLVREAAAKLDLNKVIASGAAPRVSIVTPAAGGNVADDEVTVEASIVEQNGGGVGRIEWRVNGVTLGIETRGLERLPEGTASSPVASRPAVTVKRTLALEPGENRIEVVAYNGRDLIASDPAQITLKWDGEKSATPPKLHVLAVGVNDYYDSRLKLSYAVPDVRALGDAMKQAGGSLYQSVEVISVLDDKVTVDNLDKVFTEISGKVHPRDVFVFFLAGHGKTVDGRYHFLPQNFRYEDETSIVKRGIDQERFQAWFAKIPARKSILLYDTCESGSLTGDRVQQRGIERVAALEKMTRAMGRTVLSASTDDAPALEGYRGHGVFTYALLDGLQAADTNNNGLIEVTELAAFVDQKVPDLSYQAFKMRQIPQMKIVGSSFPVVSKTSVLQVPGVPSTSEPVSTKPTHVVISSSPIDVYVAAARGGVVVQQLAPGTTVTLIEGANGWQFVAKDGKKLGYIEEKLLLKLQ